ncbi:hypothetical protein KPL74_21150 [Bacillus sp. NP157]|nr:hypothetical protein KPL74_21150 [Bacillus sp. NP157]
MHNEKFEAFLDRQRERRTAYGNIDVRRKAWLARVEDLYATVETSLDEYVERGKFRIQRGSINAYEDPLGNYKAPTLRLDFGHSDAEFIPVGTYLFGVLGRVDLVGGRDTLPFVLVAPDATKPMLAAARGALRERDATAAYAADLRKVQSFVWKVSPNPPNIHYRELTETSLTDAIIAVAHG